MGGLLQKLLLKLLPEPQAADSNAERQHVTAALGCCSTIRIDEHFYENAHHDKEDAAAEDDSSDLG